MREKYGYTKKKFTTKGADWAGFAARQRSCPSIPVLLHTFFYDVLGVILVSTHMNPWCLKFTCGNLVLLICDFGFTMISLEIQILLIAFLFCRFFKFSIYLGILIRLFGLT